LHFSFVKNLTCQTLSYLKWTQLNHIGWASWPKAQANKHNPKSEKKEQRPQRKKRSLDSAKNIMNKTGEPRNMIPKIDQITSN
jgi:hypothetical protein